MKKTISLMIMACMLLLAACDNYLDIQPTGSVIPNSLAEYRALLARSYKDVRNSVTGEWLVSVPTRCRFGIMNMTKIIIWI